MDPQSLSLPPATFLAKDPHDWSVEAAACELVSPLDQFADWLLALPERVQDTLAGSVAGVLALDPLFQRVVGDPKEHFSNLMAWLVSAPERYQEVLSRWLLLRGAVDVLAFAHRASADDFLLRQDETAALLDKAQAHGDTAAVQILEEQPDEDAIRARQWMEAASSWRKLRASVFGDEALSCWYEIAGWQQD